ncbi:MAG: hypothetical protein FJY88_05680 [Candidatus Eisenbacteria bacterium]|nr:hypothetical protein [Candidatus Eisenbacteria bacterium]
MKARSAIVTALFVLLVLLGCVQDEGSLPENQMPRTYLSILEPGTIVDTTDYRKALRWWGTDLDGEVTGYLIRWDGGWEPPAGTRYDYQGQIYSFTTATEDTFDVPIGGELATRTFTVRAIDDLDLVDARGPSQSFYLSNHIPHIEWNPDLALPDTSLAAFGFGWRVTDFDGRSTVSRFKLWIDSDSANARTVTDTVAAVRPEDFPERVDGDHTIHVRAYDDAMAASAVTLTHTWHVRWPQDARWLLLRQFTAEGQVDKWDRVNYRAMLDEVAGGSLYEIDMVTGPNFATTAEIEPLCSLFEGVIWLSSYIDPANEIKMARNLRTAEEGLKLYAERGGKVLLIGQSLLGSDGGLSDRFAREALGISEFFRKVPVEPGEITTTSLPLGRNEYVYYAAGAEEDSLRVFSSSPQTEFFPQPRSPASGRYWVRPGTVRRMSGRETTPDQTAIPAYVGVISEHGAGTVGVVTCAYGRLFPNPPGQPDPAQLQEGFRFFREVLQP